MAVSTPEDQAAAAARTLRDRRMAAWQEYKTISARAAAADRELSAAEYARCKALQEEMAALDARIMSASRTGAFFDEDNPLLAQVPVRLDTGTIGGQGEEPRGILTWRTASTTLTVVAGAEDLKVWADILAEMAASLKRGDQGPQIRAATAAEVMRLGRDGKGRMT